MFFLVTRTKLCHVLLQCELLRTPVVGGFGGLRLPLKASIALDLVGCKAVGAELEIFEASVQRGKAPEILQIGTDQETVSSASAKTC